eukprot:CAMPEP_0180216766 /NCGR_PEP_ID=MMETSP0987-20121128/16467_1 /TAXON_ID=697907 /ORGANISM="non described non described, Strain CCMP2293" /LENGTH=314 /DNA_ID=CAMNT_0022176039 /DNA_START=33 /DNA_END=977 /DNA_ORIENTATION=+
MKELAAFQTEVEDSYTTTNQAYASMTAEKLPLRSSNLVYARAPPVEKADYYLQEDLPKTETTARRWASINSTTYGNAHEANRMERAETALDYAYVKSRPNTQALEEPYVTEPPMMDIPASSFYHGPMPDRAINQHFLHRKTTASVIDGTGMDQTVEVPLEAAEPQFYYLRDGDGTRRVLEVRDNHEPVAIRSIGHAGDEMSKELRKINLPPAVPNLGFKSTNASTYTDQQGSKDRIERRAAEIAAERAHNPSSRYGEEKRIAVPQSFTITDGFPTTNRKTELHLKRGYIRDPNPPRACVSEAAALIYSTAPPPF